MTRKRCTMALHIFIFFFFFRLPAWAEVYTLDIEAQVTKDQKITKSISVTTGKPGILAYNDTIIQLFPEKTATETIKTRILIQKKSSESLEIIARSTIITRLNQPAEISQQNEKGETIYRLKLTPKSN